MRLRNAINWSKWNWEDFITVKPIVGQTVEVVKGQKQVIRAVFDPKWEHCFSNEAGTETLGFTPTLWRNILGNMGYQDYNRKREQQRDPSLETM